jgi:hypothetical protein
LGKTKRSDKEYSREQKLAYENKQLKKEVSSLRKQLLRLDIDRYSTLKDTIEKHYKEDQEHAQTGQNMLDKLKRDWACRECEDGTLEIFTYNRVESTYYYRICSNAPRCKNRTKSQRYDPDLVKGIVKKPIL